MKKRVFALLVALCLVVGMVPVTANAAQLDDGLVYEIRWDNCISIKGYTGNEAEVTIPSEIDGLPVTEIGWNAFSGCTSLTSVKLPDSLTIIGVKAFENCSNLTSIDIPDGVTEIDMSTFAYCSSLASIKLPDSLTTIGPYAFLGCSSLTSIDIPDGVTEIRTWAFYDCSSLSSIDNADGVVTIGDWAFGNCTSLTSVRLSNNLTMIGQAAFSHCSSLTSIDLPSSLTAIESFAFQGCHSLTSIDIPASVTTIGERAFVNCISLTGIHVDSNNPSYSSDSIGVLFNKEKTELIKMPEAITGSYTIPDGVTTIVDHALGGCPGLTFVNIPACVTSIGYNVFGGNPGLTGIHVDEHNPNYSSDDHGVLFDKEKNALIQAPGAIEGAYTIPDSVTSIGDFAFMDIPNLTSVRIPDSVTEIGTSAFNTCASLTSIYFEGDAPKFGYHVLYGVIATAYYPAGNPTWTSDVMQDYNGNIKWVPYDANHSHDYSAVVTAPTCTEQGYTTYSCECGDSYISDYVDALGHDYVDGICTRCGEGDPDYVKPNPFTDVPGDSFYYGPVLWAVENGITNGATADTFNPGGECMRAHVVTFLWRAAGQPEPTSTVNPFEDVKESDFYYKAVLWAVEMGITNGADATHFNPMGICNRAQVVTFLHRAFGSPALENGENPFADVPADTWYTAPVLWAVETGITNGMGQGLFGVNSPCNRAQIVTFLYRAYTE